MLRRLVKPLRSQRGDTILEVMIVIAVLSLVLTVSFAMSNRSTQGTRQSQERSEAVKHTQSQMELLKAYISRTATPALPTTGSSFCMRNDGTPSPVITGINPNAEAETFTAFNGDPALADCQNEHYFSYIQRTGDTFTAHTRWYKVGSNGGAVDEATMVHRLYPDLASGSGDGGTVTVGCPVNHYMNSIGGCIICPAGYSSPGGTSTSCAPVLPRIIVKVQKIRPDAVDYNTTNPTPSCGSGNIENKSGISTSLNRPGVSLTASTDSNSDAIYDGLAMMPSNYLASTTAPSNYDVCPPPNQPAAHGGIGASVGVGTTRTVYFKVRPICYTVPVYGSVDRGRWEDSNADRHNDPKTYYWTHPGPDWGPNGPATPTSGPPNERYNIGSGKPWPAVFAQTEGGKAVEYRHFDKGWYNRFVQEWYYTTHIVQNVWVSNWVTEQVGTRYVCPA